MSGWLCQTLQRVVQNLEPLGDGRLITQDVLDASLL